VKGAAYPVAFLAGATAVLGFSPLDYFFAVLGALVALVHLLVSAQTRRAAFAIGYLFGLGLFVAGVSWIYISLNRYGAMPAPIAAFATLAFCAFLALFPATAAWLEARLAAGATPALRAALTIPAAWTLLEWLRGWILTGFPWLSMGYATIDDALGGYAPLGGVYATGMVLVSAAGLVWCIATGAARWIAATALAVLLAAGFGLRMVQWTQPAGEPTTVSLLQGNVPQEMKFDPARYERTLQAYAELAEGSRARLIVLPETALPRFLDRVDPAYLERLSAAARRNSGDLLLGVPTSRGEDYYNSVISLGTAPRQSYHKQHLVPFGEFVPWGFGWIVRVLSIPLSDFSRGSAEQKPLALAGQRVALNVCYEDAYGREIARQLPEATLLVNVSNVAWFGDSLAPGQHLQISRMRALETGRWHLTAANTGATAAIAPDGAVRARMPQFVRGQVEATVQGYSGATPYVSLGDWPALALALALLAFVALRKRSR
jgi:apolipoprotein N-acyltransferase